MKHTRPYDQAARGMGALGQQPEDESPRDIGLLSGFPVGQVAQLVVLLDDLRETVPPPANVAEASRGVQLLAAGIGRFGAVRLINPIGLRLRQLHGSTGQLCFIPDPGTVLANVGPTPFTSFRGPAVTASLETGDTATNPLTIVGGIHLSNNRGMLPELYLPPGVGALVIAEVANVDIDVDFQVQEPRTVATTPPPPTT